MGDVLKAGRDNWYRNDTWSFKIECAFLAKLNRTRGQGPQYLAIQILHLADTAPNDALHLAEFYFESWSDPFHDGQVYMSQARAHVALNNAASAADRYEVAIVWQQDHPSHQVGAELAYAMHVTEHAMDQRYQTAIDALSHVDPDGLLFPLDRFHFHASKAMIASTKDEATVASKNAKAALDAADQETSGFRFHPNLGLVPFAAAPTIARLKRLVNLVKQTP